MRKDKEIINIVSPKEYCVCKKTINSFGVNSIAVLKHCIVFRL
jgi:hypothetical protein